MNQSETRATSYTTIGAGVVHELEIKRSRFITYLRRVETEQDARDLVAELRRSHFDARHHCTAFVLGADRDVQRSNDDGEPSGTAGGPMLEALTRRETHDGGADLSDVAAVVVRYFGGVLLGAGGLVRAYSESVSAALDEARLVRRQRMRRYDVVAEMTIAPRLENDLRTSGYQVLGTDYSPGPDGQVRAGISVALADAADVEEAFSAYLASHTAGGASWQRGETEWVDR